MSNVTRTIFGAVAAGLMAASGAASAQDIFQQGQEPDPGFYAGIGAGLNFLEKNETSGVLPKTSIESNTGPAVILNLGYAFGNGLRVEFEPGYRSNDTDTYGGVHVNGTTETASAMVNGIYDFGLVVPEVPLTPHVGFGLGYAHVSTGAGPVHGSDDTFAYQAIGGVDYALAPQFVLGLDYRYFVATDTSFDVGASGQRTSLGDLNNHSVLLTLRYLFGGEEAETPRASAATPMAPAAAAAAPTAPQPGYTIYFNWDSAGLTGSALLIVDQAAAAAKKGPPVHIGVTGYTDTTGSEAYNQKLSERRAAAVKAELVHQGVSADEIATSGHGLNDLAVPTQSEVREPRNRRVLIVVGASPGV